MIACDGSCLPICRRGWHRHRISTRRVSAAWGSPGWCGARSRSGRSSAARPRSSSIATSSTPKLANDIARNCAALWAGALPLAEPPPEFSFSEFVVKWGLIGLAGYAGFRIGKKRGWF